MYIYNPVCFLPNPDCIRHLDSRLHCSLSMKFPYYNAAVAKKVYSSMDLIRITCRFSVVSHNP